MNIPSLSSPSYIPSIVHPSSHVASPSPAQFLPSHILIDIFLEVVHLNEHEDSESGEEIDESMHGFYLVGWDSNESIRHLALVCRSWQDSALFVLYQSVALLAATSTKLFLGLISKHPHLGRRTSSLVLGLGKHREDVLEEEEAHLVESLKVIEVLAVCPNLRQLQLRPLHYAARPSLVTALALHRLETFAYVARFQGEGSGWMRGLLHPSDLPLVVSPTLRKLELDFDGGTNLELSPTSLLHAETRISSLRLQINFPVESILAMVTSCATTLQHLNLYVEAPIPIRSLITALNPPTSVLRSLSIIVNPTLKTSLYTRESTTTVLTTLLSSLPKLISLRTSARNLPLTSFPYLPPKLQHLCLYDVGAEVTETLQVLEEFGSQIPRKSDLEVVCVHDRADRWAENDVNQTRLSLSKSGVLLKIWDSEHCEFKFTRTYV